MQFPIKFRPSLIPDLDCDLLNEAQRRYLKFILSRSVNGFVMASYCDLLGREATVEEMRFIADLWPENDDHVVCRIEAWDNSWDGENGRIAACAPKSMQTQAIIDERRICSSPDDWCGCGTEADFSAQEAVSASFAIGPGVRGDMNGQGASSASSSAAGREARTRIGQNTTDEKYPDPDKPLRFWLRKHIMLGDEYINKNLRRMIKNTLNRYLGLDDYGNPSAAGEQILCDLCEGYKRHYRAALEADFLAAENADNENDRYVLVYEEQAKFGVWLYRHLRRYLARNYGAEEPIQSFTHDERLVTASNLFTWYMTFDHPSYSPGFGEFDVWATHPAVDQFTTGEFRIPPETGGPLNRGGPWEGFPGNLYSVWSLIGDEEKAQHWLDQHLKDAAEAGVDILYVDGWVRPAQQYYPWDPACLCCPIIGSNCGSDAWPFLEVEQIVRSLNRLKNQGYNTPKIALAIDSPVFEMEGDSKWNKNYPLGWAAGLRQRSAAWFREEPTAKDIGLDHELELCFHEGNRFFASIVRAFYEKVPLEHMAFIAGRAVCTMWNKKLSIQDKDGVVEGINALFKGQFYGRTLWFMPEESWVQNGIIWGSSTIDDNVFIYKGPIDPFDTSEENREQIYIGNIYKSSGTEKSERPWLEDNSTSRISVYSVAPAINMMCKRWTHEGAARGSGKLDYNLLEREFGLRYFRFWRNALIDGLSTWPELSGDLPIKIPPDGDHAIVMPPDGGSSPEYPKVRAMNIVSWNERYEGQSVGRSNEYGDAYLMMTKVFAGIWKDGFYYLDDLDWLVDVTLEMFTGGHHWPVGLQYPFGQSWYAIACTCSTLLSARRRHSPQASLAITPVSLAEPLPVRKRIERRQLRRYLPLTLYCEGSGKYVGPARVWIKFFPNPDKGQGAITAGWTVFRDDNKGDIGFPRDCALVKRIEGPVPIEPIVPQDEERGFLAKIVQGNENYTVNKLWLNTANEEYRKEFPLISLYIPDYGFVSLLVMNIDLEAFTQYHEIEDTDVAFVIGGGYTAPDGRYTHLQTSVKKFNLRDVTTDEPRWPAPERIFKSNVMPFDLNQLFDLRILGTPAIRS